MEIPAQSQDIIPGIIQEPQRARRELLSQIQEITNRHILNYSATSFGSQGEIMQAADITNLTRVMCRKSGLAGVDLILNSPGGSAEIAEKMITTLRHYYDDDLRVIVPVLAKSAATIVCLGADRILMGYCSELGPIDPQMLVGAEGGRGVFRSAHAIVQSVDSYVQKVHEAISNQEPFEGFLRLLDFRPDLAFVEECRLAQQLSTSIAERWLKAKMLCDDHPKAERTANALSRADQLYSHGRAIDYRYAGDELGLAVTYLKPDDQLWTKVWEVHIRSYWEEIQGNLAKIIESPANTLAVNA